MIPVNAPTPVPCPQCTSLWCGPARCRFSMKPNTTPAPDHHDDNDRDRSYPNAVEYGAGGHILKRGR